MEKLLQETSDFVNADVLQTTTQELTIDWEWSVNDFRMAEHKIEA